MYFVLEIKDIENLEDKLSGKIPVTREELIALINTHGRKNGFNLEIIDINTDILIEYYIKKSNPNECLPLENLDVSKIQDFSHVFCGSYYNGDLSKWKLSGDCFAMFENSEFNNNSLKYLDFKDIKHAGFMFYRSEFCGDISGWKNYNETIHIYNVFADNKNFKEKYYQMQEVSFDYSKETKQWLDENLERIREINRPKDEIILDYFDFDDNNLDLER